MIDPALLNYDFDEEREEFGPPATPTSPPSPTKSRWSILGILLIVAGLLSLVQCFGGPLNGTWAGFFAAYLLPSIGAGIYFWSSMRHTAPGIKHDGIFFDPLLSRGTWAWIGGVLITGFYVLLYWFPELLGHQTGGEPTGLIQTVDAPARWLTGSPASQWFLYGVLYTLAILVFGIRMFMKYRHSRYHIWRTASVMAFQSLFAWLLPNLLVLLRYPYMEFNGVWPLKYDYLWPGKVSAFNAAGAVGIFLLVWAVGLVVATPILTYFFGKRWYCSWVCGCGGLAETLGDPWRQLSDKSTASWHLERWLIHSVLGVVVLVTLAIWADHAWGWFGNWSGSLKQWYGFYIGAVFSGVIGVGFYPLLGNRVWCRFGCPQAAILGIFQRTFSKFRITTNGGQCMSCGNCSTYCEMGIDVRAYAQNQENTVRASCVGCGVCAAVCPRGVLRLENGPFQDRFPGATRPLQVLGSGLKSPKIYDYQSWGETKSTQSNQSTPREPVTDPHECR